MMSLFGRRGLQSDRPELDSVASKWLTMLGLGVAVAMLVLGCLAAYSAREDTFRTAQQEADNLRIALVRDISRNFAVFDLSLRGVIDALAQPGIDQTTPGLRNLALFDRATSAEYLGSVLVLDATGAVTDSSPPVPRGRSFADREYFTVHRDNPDAGLFISHVYQSRLANNEPSIALSRRLPSPSGRFIGVVSGALRLRFFQALFEKIDVGPMGSITLVRTDGRMVWRYPSQDGGIDIDWHGTDTFRHLSSAEQGQYVGPSPVDGVTRLFTFARVGTTPLILSVNLSTDDIYARWRQKALVILPILTVMCLAIVALTLLFRHEMHRREAAEAALTDAARDLSLMAATDALTGLANRRTLEERIDQEWKRAIRDRRSLSLLMVDADNFKSFNDLYGHPEGDRILKLVASTLQRSVLRPADLAARYGGEEFIALLPGCDAAGALMIAERIRSTIENLRIPHKQGTDGLVTVSVGAATASPTTADRAADLLKAADQALYAAKRDGRNRVRAPEEPAFP